MKLNNEGSSIVDVVIGLLLILMTLGFLFQFNSYLINSKEKQEINSIFFATIHNETERAYKIKDWETLEGVVFNSNWGEVGSSFSDYHVTTHNTESIVVTVTLAEKESSVIIERSLLN